MGVSRDRRELVPDPLPTDMGYFDHKAMLRDLREMYPDVHLSSRKLAFMLGLPRSTIRYLMAGKQPSLYTYCRICAFVEVPMGTWVRLRAPSP